MFKALIGARLVLLASVFSIVISSSAQAASITLDANGILLGAKDVIVNGTAYDVEFIDGTCAQVFGACDLANFAFTTEAAANAASSALFAQVLLDGPQGNFDSDVTLTNGCGHLVMEIDQCFALTPYATFTNVDGAAVRISVALNYLAPHPSNDQIVASYASVLYDSGTDAEAVFAKWTAVPQSVPDDASTVSLIGLSVAILLTMRRAA